MVGPTAACADVGQGVYWIAFSDVMMMRLYTTDAGPEHLCKHRSYLTSA